MTPTELFQEARLGEAVAAQLDVIRLRPEDIAERLLLCDLLAFTGDRDAVRCELNRIRAHPSPLVEFLAEWFDLLTADDLRHAGKTSQFFVEFANRVAGRLHAEYLLRTGDQEGALDKLECADEDAPWAEGNVDGREFEGWRDADDILGPVLEVVRGAGVFWIPVECIHKVRLEERSSLRDSLYRPATVWLSDGSALNVFVTTLYVGTSAHAEDGIRTGAGVDWIDSGGIMRGLGARTFLFGEEELTLEDFRQVEVRRAIGRIGVGF